MSAWLSIWSAALWRASWQGGLAIGVAWLVCRGGSRLPDGARSWLWRIAYLKLLVSALAIPSVEVRIPLEMRAPVPVIEARTVPALETAAPLSPVTVPALSSDFYATMAGPVRGVLFLVWLTGVLLAAGRIVIEVREAGRLKRRPCLAEDGQLSAIVAELSRRMGLSVVPDVQLCQEPGSPRLLGGCRPTILIPEPLASACGPHEMRLMIAHELAHVRRRDLAWSWLPSAAGALFFFHPLIRVAHREWRLTQEIACDEMAIRSTRAAVGAYGTALLKAAAQCRRTPTAGLAAIRAEEFPQMLARRLTAMKHLNQRSRRIGLAGGVTLAALAGVLLVPWRVVAEPTNGGKVPPSEAKADPQTGILDMLRLYMHRRTMALSQLGLTAVQRSRAEAATHAAWDQVRATVPPGTEPTPAIKQAIHAAIEGLTTALQGILTPEQFKRFSSLVEGDPGKPLPAFMGKGGPPIIPAVILGKIDVSAFAAKLGLTAEQQARIQAVVADAHARLMAIEGNASLPKEQRAEQMSALFDAFIQQVQQMLTPDQVKLLAEFGERKPGNPREALGHLKLSADQQVQIHALLEMETQQTRPILEDKNLPDDQKKIDAGQIHEAIWRRIFDLLTPEQRVELKTAGAVRAAEPGEIHAKIEMTIKRIMALDLSDEQHTRLMSLFNWGHESAHALLSDDSLAAGQRQERLETLGRDVMGKVHAILTPAQWVQLSKSNPREEKR